MEWSINSVINVYPIFMIVEILLAVLYKIITFTNHKQGSAQLGSSRESQALPSLRSCTVSNFLFNGACLWFPISPTDHESSGRVVGFFGAYVSLQNHRYSCGFHIFVRLWSCGDTVVVMWSWVLPTHSKTFSHYYRLSLPTMFCLFE